MCHLVPEHGLYFRAVHLPQEPGAHRHQRGVTVCAGRKRVGLGGIENADLRHTDSHPAGVILDHREQPLLGRVGRRADDLHAHEHLGLHLRQGERDEGAAEAEQRGPHQQARETAAAFGEPHVEPEQVRHDRQHQQHGEVGREEQHDAFHDGLKTLSGIEGLGEGIEARRHSTVGDLRFASFGGGKRLFKGCGAAPRVRSP